MFVIGNRCLYQGSTSTLFSYSLKNRELFTDVRLSPILICSFIAMGRIFSAIGSKIVIAVSSFLCIIVLE